LFLVGESVAPQLPVILASTSPYRRALLERLGLPFAVESPGVTEEHAQAEAPADRAVRLAVSKAQVVADRYPNAFVIGSDQVAAVDGAVLDKPGDADRACGQLTGLSGKRADFYTACSILCQGNGLSETHLDTTHATFRVLSREEIERYVARERPLDCAGSFKSEGLGISLLERIESEDPTGLIGLPLIWLAGALRRAGYRLP
jgi:septum formation protein